MKYRRQASIFHGNETGSGGRPEAVPDAEGALRLRAPAYTSSFSVTASRNGIIARSSAPMRAPAYTSSFSVTASRNGIIARSSAPTFSSWCACSCRRCAMNQGRPALSSSIHLRA